MSLETESRTDTDNSVSRQDAVVNDEPGADSWDDLAGGADSDDGESDLVCLFQDSLNSSSDASYLCCSGPMTCLTAVSTKKIRLITTLMTTTIHRGAHHTTYRRLTTKTAATRPTRQQDETRLSQTCITCSWTYFTGFVR